MTLGSVLLLFSMVLVAGALFGSFALMMMGAMSVEGHERVEAELRAISTAAIAYREEHGAYPSTDSIDELRALLVPTYAAEIPRSDPWSNDYIVESSPELFRVGSGGEDGGELDLVGAGGAVESYGAAVIYRDGVPVQWQATIAETASWSGLTDAAALLPMLIASFVGVGLWLFVRRGYRDRNAGTRVSRWAIASTILAVAGATLLVFAPLGHSLLLYAFAKVGPWLLGAAWLSGVVATFAITRRDALRGVPLILVGIGLPTIILGTIYLRWVLLR